MAIQRVASILFQAHWKLSKDHESIFDSLKEDQGMLRIDKARLGRTLELGKILPL